MPASKLCRAYANIADVVLLYNMFYMWNAYFEERIDVGTSYRNTVRDDGDTMVHDSETVVLENARSNAYLSDAVS